MVDEFDSGQWEEEANQVEFIARASSEKQFVVQHFSRQNHKIVAKRILRPTIKMTIHLKFFQSLD